MLKFSRTRQRGDTLVEVLIAVAIISSVLTGAFLVSQKSATAVRTSQEQSEMVQILQGQVELIRSLAIKQTDDTSGVYATAPIKYFCIDNSDPANPVRVNSSNSLPPVASDTFESGTVYNPECLNLQGRYNVAVIYDQTAKLFNLTGRYAKLSGGNSQVTLSYRIYPGKPVAAAVPAVGNAAFIIPGACGGPTEPACPTPTGASTYSYTKEYINQSINDPGLVTSCDWIWGDGTSASGIPGSDPRCKFNQSSGIHTYPKASPELAPPLSCNTMKYTVILVMHLSNGQNPQYPTDKYMPDCF